MGLKTVRVIKRALVCRTCETEFFGYSEIRENEEGSAAKLYECTECTAIFAVSDEASLQASIIGKRCPDCHAPLEESLEKKIQAGSCPMCEDRDYYGTGESEEIDLEAYVL